MDSVLNIEKCKICGGLVRIEDNAYVYSKICTCCGYYYNRDKLNNEYQCRSGNGSDAEGNITGEVEYLNPCGAYKLVTLSGVAKSGTLGENLSEEQVLNMFNFNDISRLDMNKSYINYRNAKINEFKIIFGNGKPESYDNFVGTIEK